MTLSTQMPRFWNVPAADLLQRLQTTAQGLTSSEAQQRLTSYGSNLLKPKKKSNIINLLKIMVSGEGKFDLNLKDEIICQTCAVHNREYISPVLRQILNIK